MSEYAATRRVSGRIMSATHWGRWIVAIVVLGLLGCGGRRGGLVTETDRFEFKVPATELARMEIDNPSGRVTVRGVSVDGGEIEVAVEQSTLGVDAEEVHRVLSNIEVYADKEGSTQKIGWRRKPNTPHWDATVNLTIKAPSHLTVEIKSKRGNIEVNGFDNPVTAIAQSGSIKVLDQRADMNLETRSGDITLDTSGEKIRMVTYNGRITADLSKARRIDGAIIATNGPVGVVVGKSTDAEFTCEANDSKVDFATQFIRKLPVSSSKRRRGPIVGIAGAGTGKIKIESRNGSIRLR